MPTSAAASAGASLTPSPAIATIRPCLRSPSTSGTLVSGKNARPDIADAKPARDGLSGGLIIAGEHNHAHALIAQRLDRAKRRLFDRIGNRDEPSGLTVNANEYDGGAVLAQIIGSPLAVPPS